MLLPQGTGRDKVQILLQSAERLSVHEMSVRRACGVIGYALHLAPFSTESFQAVIAYASKKESLWLHPGSS